MPLYDYACATCGPFRAWRGMSEWEASVPCPDCSLPAPRLASVAMLAVLSASNRVAHERNERSAHEPKVMRREDLPRERLHQGHRPGASPLVRQQFGAVHEGARDRPWMVGH